MDASQRVARRPSFQPSPEEKRALLLGHYMDFLESELKDGRSFADLSIEHLVGGVGISRSTFYAYFKDKTALLQALVEIVTQDLVQAGRTWFELGPRPDEAELKDALRPLFEGYRAHRHVLRAVVESVHDQRIREQYSRLLGIAVDRLTVHVDTIESLPPGLDSRRAAQWLVAMYERGLYQLVSHADDDEFEAQLDAAVAVTWQALYAYGRN